MCIGKSLKETFRTAAGMGGIRHIDSSCVTISCLVLGIVRSIIGGEIVRESRADSRIQSAYSWVDGQRHRRNPQRTSVEDSEATFQGSSARSTSSASQVDTKVPQNDLTSEDSLLDSDEYHHHCHGKTLRELKLDERRSIGHVFKCLGIAVWYYDWPFLSKIT